MLQLPVQFLHFEQVVQARALPRLESEEVLVFFGGSQGYPLRLQVPRETRKREDGAERDVFLCLSRDAQSG